MMPMMVTTMSSSGSVKPRGRRFSMGGWGSRIGSGGLPVRRRRLGPGVVQGHGAVVAVGLGGDGHRRDHEGAGVAPDVGDGDVVNAADFGRDVESQDTGEFRIAG